MPMSDYRVIESLYAEQDGDPITVRRTWRERLLTRPWRPWRATRIVIPRVPCAFTLPGGLMVMHPTLVHALRIIESNNPTTPRKDQP